MNEALSADEVAGLRRLARPRAVAKRPPEADLIVLTATELFARSGLLGAWAEAGGRAASLAPDNFYGMGPELTAIADLTQQIHLGDRDVS